MNNKESLIMFTQQELYLIDPAGTYCNINDSLDEYVSEAKRVAGLVIDEGMTLEDALTQTFDTQFAGMYDAELLDKACARINGLLS